MTSPTIPPWAARVWVEGDKLFVDLPMGEELPSHRLTFPADLQGMHRLRSLLANRNARSVLGTKGDLTQWQVTKQLRQKLDLAGVPVHIAKPKDKFTPDLRAAARTVLRGFGLIGAVKR